MEAPEGGSFRAPIQPVKRAGPETGHWRVPLWLRAVGRGQTCNVLVRRALDAQEISLEHLDSSDLWAASCCVPSQQPRRSLTTLNGADDRDGQATLVIFPGEHRLPLASIARSTLVTLSTRLTKRTTSRPALNRFTKHVLHLTVNCGGGVR